MVSFHSYPWEGKGFKYYVKDTIRNRPVMFLVALFHLSIVPGGLWLQYATEKSNQEYASRFKTKYIVYRDDDPRVRNIVRFDENGKRIYLEPRTN